MDNFKSLNEDQDSELLSDSSFQNSYLFKFIFDDKENLSQP